MELLSLYNVAEVELTYKNHCNASERPQVTCSKDSYDILIQSWDENKIEFIEQAKIILLSRSNRVLGVLELSSGGISGTVVDPKLIFVAALKANASGVILAHNHPSGNLKPSDLDKRLTDKIMEAGNFLDIKVMDHLIVTREGYYSFGEDRTRLIDYNPFLPF